MPKVILTISGSVEQNAAAYFEKAKKLKRKAEGAKKAVAGFRQQIESLEEKKAAEKIVKKESAPARTKKWYENFRWFVSSEGFLCIGGRDATTNEIIIKKHTSRDDVVLHTDMAGSPFFVIKVEGIQPTELTLREAADATVTYSRAWKLGLAAVEVFCAKPEQLTKETKPGEYITRGAFVVKGKVSYVRNSVNLAIGITVEGAVMAGPVEAVKKNCGRYAEVVRGREKTSDVAKRIQKKIGGELDEIVRALPPGGCEIKE